MRREGAHVTVLARQEAKHLGAANHARMAARMVKRTCRCSRGEGMRRAAGGSAAAAAWAPGPSNFSICRQS